MDELDDGCQLVMVSGRTTTGAAGQHHQHGPQSLAASGNNVVGDLVDQHHVRSQPAADQGIHGGHVGGGEGLDLGQGEAGLGVFDDSHGQAAWEVAEL